MEPNSGGSELTVREMIELKLCAVDAVIDTIGDNEPLLNIHRTRLRSLLNRLDGQQIAPEYAECELERITDEEDQWFKDNPIPPD